MTKIDEFMSVYAPKLKQQMDKHPGMFMTDHATLVSRVRKSLETKGVMSIDIRTISWRHSAKHFGFANTYVAWREWFDNGGK